LIEQVLHDMVLGYVDSLLYSIEHGAVFRSVELVSMDIFWIQVLTVVLCVIVQLSLIFDEQSNILGGCWKNNKWKALS
jgi:hypothetical protein